MGDYSTLFIDLDETIYPQDCGVWEAVGERINQFVEETLGVGQDLARELRAKYLHEYGTTLNGLIAVHHIDPMDYLDFVHAIPIEDMLDPDPALKIMLSHIQAKKVIFTNAYLAHALRVLESLGIRQEIDLIVDIITLEFVNKPRPEAYLKALELVGERDAHACIMVDDRHVNLETASAMGMVTVLVGREVFEAGFDYHIPRITDLSTVLPELLQ
jgi:pyrimidine 5'-nucleotidase